MAEDKARDESDRDETERDEVDASEAQKPGEAAETPADEADDEDGADAAEADGEASSDESKSEGQGPHNRAERRRALAQKRRRGKGSAFDEVPKDRNLRKRQELLEKRKGAKTEGGEGDGSDVSDVSLAVDDALARTGDAAGRWLKRNWGWMQWALVAGIVGGVGSLVYVWRSGTANAANSDVLASAVAAELARVVPADKDKRTDEEKKKSDRVVYATYAEREKVALERYERAALAKPGSGTAVLARLGIAGAKLDQREWDAAIAAYEDVLKSKLAEADVDVKGRALEGLGFAYEGKKDLEKANATFDKLGELSQPLFKILAKYHHARILLGKGDKDGAKKLLDEARKAIETAELEVKTVSGGGMNPFLGIRNVVEQTLKRIDPSAVPPKFIQGGGAPGAGGAQITPEQIKQLLEQKGLQPGMPGRAE